MVDPETTTEELQQPYKLYKADSGAITFEIIAKTCNRESWLCPAIFLIDKECPHKTVYKIQINYSTGFIVLDNNGQKKQVDIPTCIQYTSMYLQNMPQMCWLSWYNNTIQFGFIESSKCVRPFFEYQETFTKQSPKQLIGFIGFTINKYIDWNVATSPVIVKPISQKKINGGQLRWVKTSVDKLPSDALIGGFENEPLYIARARHNGSMCPGKYVPSKKMAFVPWGHDEHKKTDFEILCGFNAVWVKCKKNYVPENVFIAGTSEVRGEDVYIGRALVEGNLVVGKVHMLYKTCYLPYKGREVEKYNYEILVRGDMITRGETSHKNCSLNPMKTTQPCI